MEVDLSAFETIEWSKMSVDTPEREEGFLPKIVDLMQAETVEKGYLRVDIIEISGRQETKKLLKQ